MPPGERRAAPNWLWFMWSRVSGIPILLWLSQFIRSSPAPPYVGCIQKGGSFHHVSSELPSRPHNILLRGGLISRVAVDLEMRSFVTDFAGMCLNCSMAMNYPYISGDIIEACDLWSPAWKNYSVWSMFHMSGSGMLWGRFREYGSWNNVVRKNASTLVTYMHRTLQKWCFY